MGWHGTYHHINCVRSPVQQSVLSTQTEPVDPWSARGVSRAVNGVAAEPMSSDDKKRLAELGASAGDKVFAFMMTILIISILLIIKWSLVGRIIRSNT